LSISQDRFSTEKIEERYLSKSFKRRKARLRTRAGGLSRSLTSVPLILAGSVRRHARHVVMMGMTMMSADIHLY
jgi:hypothetical protein